MIFDYIIVISIIIIIAVILWIIAKQFPVISSINIAKLKKHQQGEVKKHIIEDRLKRKLGIIGIKNRQENGAVKKRGTAFINNFYQSIKSLEKKYREKIRVIEPPEEGAAVKKKTILLQEAKVFAEQQKYKEAEEKFIEVISLDNKYSDAYECLAELYVEKKDYDHALEIFKYLLKMHTTDIGQDEEPLEQVAGQESSEIKPVSLNKEVADYQIGLGEVYLAMGEAEKAMGCFKEAIKLEPNNPRNIDAMIRTALKVKNKVIANEYIAKLQEVNPENEKLKDFEKEMSEL